jgi:UDP-N-acetylmuramoyl-L-alanyl-D-glutamate--2,6-diaminopimelate ligase
MKLNEILHNIDFKGNPDNRDITNITYDSRKVKDGSLFIAISGENQDGHDYILEAIDKGASAIIANGRAPISDIVPILQVTNPRKTMSKIASNFYNNPSKNLNIIGITGTNGKTTTTQIVDYIIKSNNRTSSSLGTLGFNTPSGMISTGFTTPESIELQQILDTIKKGGIEYVPMEISSHAIELYRTNDVDINIAIFTNMGHDHLDFHKSIDNYFNAKLKLFTKLNKNSLAILNYDDPYTEKIIKKINCNYLTYGFSNNADLSIKEYNLKINQSSAVLSYNNKLIKVDTQLIGKFNLYNLSAAILCALKLGINKNSIVKSVEQFINVPGRLEKYNYKDNTVIIDYAHTPDAFSNIFKNISELKSKEKKIITVFGCGGNRDKSKRKLMGEIANNYSDYIYITNDNPRFEDEDKIIDDICSGILNEKYEIIKDRKKAIISSLNSNNSIILILGKGIEKYQIIKNKKIDHSDIKIVKDCINENRN